MWGKYYSILLYVLEKKGLFGKVKTSTIKLSKELGSTQQTISRKLMEMEKIGLIKRQLEANGLILSLDDKSRAILKNNYQILKKKIEKKKNKLKGVVKAGMGEGKYYMSLPQYQSQFKAKLGFRPYSGTLNLSVKDRSKLLEFISNLEPILISGFKDKARTYGSIKCYKIKIKDLEGAIIIPERARHTEDIFELIAPVYLRGYYNLKNNNILEVDKYG